MLTLNQMPKKFLQKANDCALKIRNEIFEENSFLKNNVNPDRYDDIRTYFKGKGLDFSNESLLEAIKTHPEWINPSNATTIKSLGLEEHKKAPDVSEKQIASKFLGVDL